MPPRPYSTRLRIALAIARGIAASRGDDDTTSTHIVLGILREAANGAVAALQHAGVPVDEVCVELEAKLGPRGRTRPDEVALPLTEGERHVIEQARTESDLRGDEFIAPEHALLGILRDEQCPASQAFARHGFEYLAARAHLDAVVYRHAAPPGSPPVV